jgi:hypothetical protein
MRIEVITCKKCGLNKTRDEMARHVNREFRPFCWKCWETSASEEQKNRYFNGMDARRNQRRERARKNIRNTLLKSARGRAKKQNVPFDITIDDIIIPEFCPVLGIKIEQGIGKNTDNSPSLDKIIPKKGYVKGNIKIISWRANSLKRDSSIEELKKIIAYIETNTSNQLEN